MAEYYIPTGPGEAEFVEKRSSFLGHVRLVETEDEARAFISATLTTVSLRAPPASPCWRSCAVRA